MNRVCGDMRRTETCRSEGGLLVGLGAAVMLIIVLVVLQSFLSTGLISTTTVTITTSDAY